MRSRTLKRIIAGLVIFLIPVSALAASFSDVPDSNAHFKAIQTLKDAGIIAGYADGTFKPDANVNRAEALSIILKAAGISVEKSSTKLPFTDVPESAWYYSTLQKAVSMGKIKGYADPTRPSTQIFRPENPVTLPEAVTMATSFFQVNVKDLPVDPLIYGGLDSNQWYGPYMQYAKNQNLIETDDRGFVSATDPLTRGSLAELIYRMRSVSQSGKAFDITTGWVTEEYGENFWRIRRPPNWELALKGTANSVLVKKGKASPLFFTRIFPDGARLSISVVENPDGLSATSYFSKLKTDYTTSYPDESLVFQDRALAGFSALSIYVQKEHVFDTAIFLPNKKVLMMYAEYGSAAMGEVLKKQMETMVGSYEYVEKAPAPVLTLDQRVAQARSNILVKDGWKTISPLFPDIKLMNTDAIGIGTGPVDYYFSAEANFTMKLERDSGTILNIRDGNTSAF